MDEDLALPIAPVVPAETTVAHALELAEKAASRAVVEVSNNLFRFHATTALRSLHESGKGLMTLDRLDAIEVGRFAEGDATKPYPGMVWRAGPEKLPDHVALRLKITETPYPKDHLYAVLTNSGVTDYAVVARSYKCPKDGEKFSCGSGKCKCDRHNLDLVPDDDN